MKKILLGILIMCLFTMCSSEDDSVDPRSVEEIAYDRLIGRWYLVRYDEYDCENLATVRRGQDVGVLYSLNVDTGGRYQFFAGIGSAIPFVITGRWTFISEESEDTYKFNNTFDVFPEEIPEEIQNLLLTEGIHTIRFPGNFRMVETISDDCQNLVKGGHVWD